MSRLLKKLLAADRQQRMERDAKKLGQWFDSTKPGPTTNSTEDYLKFAEQYMGHQDKDTGEFVPMKFSEADRYLIQQMDQAIKSDMMLLPYAGRTAKTTPSLRDYSTAGLDSIDGSEVHIIHHEPWEAPFLAAHRRDYPLTPAETFPRQAQYYQAREAIAFR